MTTAQQRAKDFIENETQFHLGFLPTEQSNPLSVTLADDYQRDTVAGVATLQRIDENVLQIADKITASCQYMTMKNAMRNAILNGGRVVFSGCGATGRLSILLESMWRTACRDLAATYPEMEKYTDSVFSIMTGGDFALVKSVEFFEDYAVFGRRQVKELDMNERDVLVAITEGGETSSVLGTVSEAVERGSAVFLLFNNPADLLAEHLERSRNAIRNPKVTVLDLYCGPMALAGSTRMQATTSEQLIAGGALENVFCSLAGIDEIDHAALFHKLLEELERPENRAAIAAYTDFECDVYRKKGKVTYFTHDFLLDVFTDTTERSPTFMLPPFRPDYDKTVPQSWAFVKDVFYNTEDTWKNRMNRNLRCLDWHMPDYQKMGVSNRITKEPSIVEKDLLSFRIGNESQPERFEHPQDAAVIVTFGAESDNAEFMEKACKMTEKANIRKSLSIASDNGDFAVKSISTYPQEKMPLRSMEHMAIKLVLNTISTGVMTKFGRVTKNWMSYVALSNKKLIDRGIRLVSELGNISYEASAELIFQSMEEAEKNRVPGEEAPCIVQIALKKLQK